MSGVKRVDFFAYLSDEVAELDCNESEDGAWIPASDYDKLLTANQRLEGEVARLTENLRAIRYAAEGGPVSENSRGCVRRIERIAEAALSTNGEVT